MNYSRKYDAHNPEINVRIRQFLKAKHLTGQVEYKFQPENVNMPAGWATLTFDIVDPTFDNEIEWRHFESGMDHCSQSD